MSGLDSAIGPTLEQAQAARKAGYLWWAFYVGYQGVPGSLAAFHQWRADEVAVLFEAGFELFLPIFFPHTVGVGGPIVPTSDPELDADLAVFAALQLGVQGVVALDTEEAMRGDLFTAFYEARWVRRVVDVHGWKAVTYAGGFPGIFGRPQPTGYPWWIIPGGGQAPPGTAWQVGQTSFGDLMVDRNSIGAGFPLATRRAA